MSRIVRRASGALLVVLACAPSAVSPARAQPPGPGEEGIEVRPQPREPGTPPQPPADVTPEELDPFDLPLSYPDLADLVFGQGNDFGANTGVLRESKSLLDTPLAGDIVTPQQIIEKQAQSMFQALENEVGVMMQQTAAGQASPFVRGLTGQQVLLLVDGIRMNNSTYRFGPNQYFNTIDPGMVDHIEVLRGSGGVLWGSDAIGGVINVVSRSPDLGFARCCGDYDRREFREYYNTSNDSSYSRLNVEGWVGNTGALVGGSYLNVRDLETGFDFGRQPGTNYQQYAGDVKVNYLLDDLQLVTFAAQHFEQQELPRSDRFPGFPGDLDMSNTAADARFFDPQQRDLIYVRYQALYPNEVFDAVTATASYHRQREDQTRGLPDTMRSQEIDVETVGVNLVGSRCLGVLGNFTLGADWYHDDVDSPFVGASGPIIPDDAFYERVGAFANWSVDLTCQWSAVGGARYENIDLGATPLVDVLGAPTEVPISPHFDDWIFYGGLAYRINPCVELVGSVSEGFRAPNLDELTANNPNVLQMGMDLPSLGLTPEHSINYEVGVKTNLSGIRTQTFVFWFDLQDNIVPISAGANQFRRANQDSFIRGLEHQAEVLLPGGWSVYGNFWYIHGRNEVTGAPLSRIPPAQGIVGLRWRDPCLLGYFSIYSWIVRAQDRLDPVRDLSDERIPPGGTPSFATLNVRAGRTFGVCQQHRISLGLENITDEDYLVHGSGVFGTGITGRIGYTWLR